MKSKWYQFTVRGTGTFPLDMLRYDGCYPKETKDALNIAEDCNMRTVTLIKPVDSKNNTPTFDRWKSFGWTVIDCGYKTH